MDDQLIDVLKTLLKHRISAVPIFNDDGDVVNAVDLNDILLLTSQGVGIDLKMTVDEVIARRNEV